MSTKRNPGDYNTEIQHVSECAFQRAIIGSKTSSVNGEPIEWIDIELPVDGSNSSRGRCIDLIGIDTKANYVLCELKFRRDYHDNGGPKKAVEQLKGYFNDIKTNVHILEGLRHTNASQNIDWQKVASESTRLLVVANEEYYSSWCDRKHESLKFDNIEFYSVEIPEDTFWEQKGGDNFYTPELPEKGKIWVKKQ